MRTSVESHSGNLAVLIPAEIASKAGLIAGGSVDIELTNGRLVVRPSGPGSLQELLAGITLENINIAWEDGPPVGKELL